MDPGFPSTGHPLPSISQTYTPALQLQRTSTSSRVIVGKYYLHNDELKRVTLSITCSKTAAPRTSPTVTAAAAAAAAEFNVPLVVRLVSRLIHSTGIKRLNTISVDISVDIWIRRNEKNTLLSGTGQRYAVKYRLIAEKQRVLRS